MAAVVAALLSSSSAPAAPTAPMSTATTVDAVMGACTYVWRDHKGWFVIDAESGRQPTKSELELAKAVESTTYNKLVGHVIIQTHSEMSAVDRPEQSTTATEVPRDEL